MSGSDVMRQVGENRPGASLNVIAESRDGLQYFVQGVAMCRYEFSSIAHASVSFCVFGCQIECLRLSDNGDMQLYVSVGV